MVWKKSKKFGIICEVVIPPGLSSALWRKVSNSTWCCTRVNFILVIKVTSEFLQRGIDWRVTNALSWTKKGRGLEETIITSHKPPSAPIHKDMLLVHLSVVCQMQKILLLSLGVPDSISNHQTKVSSAFNTCLMALFPHILCFEPSEQPQPQTQQFPHACDRSCSVLSAPAWGQPLCAPSPRAAL